MKVEYNVQVWREGDQFIAHAMPLDVMSSGRTPEMARRALDEAARLFLRTAEEMGTLQEVLEECSYELQDGVWRAPEWIAAERRSTLLSA